jgi:predicted GNAT family acetyltransferase
VKDGKIVCRACSIRQNERCAEVYVATLSNYRRRGFGRQAVAAWAKQILDSRRVPFYSYRANNTPSAGLASSLNVTWYANVVAYEPMAILP